MSKTIILTEKQVEKFINNLVNEGAVGSDRYERKVRVNVETYGVTINGEEIDWATCDEMSLNYSIEIEHKSWGIRGITLFDIQGPSEIEISVTPQTEDPEDVYLNLPFNWEEVKTESESGENVVTIGDEITIKLANNENGEIMIHSINVPVYEL